MEKIRVRIKMVCLFLRLVFEMIRNVKSLNGDLANNFLVCQKICRKVVRSARIQLRVHNLENLPVEQPFLLVSNHRCFFDVVFLLATVEQPIRFVAAKELMSYPILRKYLTSIQCVMLNRYTGDMSEIGESVANMKKALASGNLVLFPEGECSYYDKRMKKFKKGGFVGVSELGAFVVPAFIRIDRMQNIGRWMIPQGEVSIYFGEGFFPSGISGKRCRAGDLAAYAQERVRELQSMAEQTL